MTKKITHSSRCIASVLKEKFKLLVVAAALVSGGLQAQTVTTITTAGAGTFTVPANVATMTVEAWGGGGAGGSLQVTTATTSNNTIRMGGGSGGSYSKVTFTNPTAGDYPYVVGAGGVLLTGFADNAVGNGGSTTFNTTGVVAVGGTGAISKSINGGVGQSINGVGAEAPTTGNTLGGTNYYGGNGGTVVATISGAGGSSAGSTGPGGNAVGGAVGAAGAGGGAVGGIGSNTNGTKYAGAAPGAGGGGSCQRAAVTAVFYPGGAGGNGQLKISYTLVPTNSTVAITAPANKTVVAIDGSIQISATIALYAGKTFSSIVFKDGTTAIPGTITNIGDVYSVTYTNVPAGKRNITAELTDNTETVISPISVIYGGPVVENGNKYAQSNITWSAGPWYNAATDGYVVSAPGAGDNVFTQGNTITIAADATCDNLTFTSAPAQIGVAAGITLTVRGQVNCTTDGTIDAFSSSDATSILKLTGTTLADPFLIVTNNALKGMKPNKLVIEPTNLANTYQFGAGNGDYIHGTNAFTVAAGTLINLKNTMVLGTGTNNHLEVGVGAIVTLDNAVKATGALSQRITKATINGTVIAKNNFNVVELIIGTNGSLKTEKAPTATFQQFDGWWGSITPADVTSFGTPASVVAGTSSFIEFSRAGNQNIPGTVFANGTMPVANFTIPYVNLTLSGTGTKTIQSSLTFTGNMTIASGITTTVASGATLTVASGATLTIASGATLTIPTGNVLYVASGGKITNEGTIVNEGTINYLSDATNGTATIIGSGTISGAGVVNVNQSLQHAASLRSWYVSSPVNTAVAPSPELVTIKSFDETNANGTTWVSATTMAPKVGYMVTPALNTDDLMFTGVLNNGNQAIALTSRTGADNKAGFNLIGNPYLSYLNWNTVYAANNAALRTSTMWYRTKNAGTYSFWTVNGDGVVSPNGASASIPPMQAFWVRAVENGSILNLTNTMREHAPASDKLLKAPALNNRTLVRLQVSNGLNTDEAVIYTSENAQNGIDNLDAPKMSNDNENIPEIYTTLGTEKIVINSFNSLPLNTALGLGFVAGNASSFSIKANEIKNIPVGVKVILRDNVTATETDMTDASAIYEFAPKSTSEDRFSIIFRTAGNTTGVNNTAAPKAQVFVNANNQIVINTVAKSNYAIYNATGMKVSQGITSQATLLTPRFAAGMYVVKINAATTKVIIK